MLLAAQVNGLTGPDVQPWQMKASFTVFDEDGNVTDRGTYEEFWASPSKYKRIYASSKFMLAEFGTERGTFRSGQRAPLPPMVDGIHREFVDPMLNGKAIEQTAFSVSQHEMDGEMLACLMIAGLPVNPGRSWCLRAGQPVLRMTSFTGESLQVLHYHAVTFQGRFVPGDLIFIRAGKQGLNAHLESIEVLSPVNEADFAPPPDATPLLQKVTISGGVAQGLLIQKTPPSYPIDAKISGIQGTVVLQASIGVDGHVADLRVVSGPPELRMAALAAVRQWVYRPYLLNGEPVTVETTVNIIFTLGR